MTMWMTTYGGPLCTKDNWVEMRVLMAKALNKEQTDAEEQLAVATRYSVRSVQIKVLFVYMSVCFSPLFYS